MKLILLFTVLCLKIPAMICMCENLNTCSDCIQYAYQKCVWCTAPDVENRCQSKDYYQKNNAWCNGKAYEPTVVQEDKSDTEKISANVVQLKPQHVTIKVSPGVSVPIKMVYQLAQDSPLDVYYLLDNSWSMDKYLVVLKKQSSTVIQQLSKLTKNIRVGIGTFMEKPLMPFSGLTNGTTFKNNLKLTDNASVIQETLNNLVIDSYNNDDQEATLTGLMQAMTCKEQVGWREDARRIIVVFTDSQYHISGEGKAAGAFQPHDMKCHIDDNMDTILDYPSASQINKIAKDNSFVIIFVVTDNVKEDYTLLAKKIYYTKCRKLSKKMNISKLLSDEYTKIINDTKITHNAPSNIEVTTTLNCKDCKGLDSRPINITATIKVLSCPNSSQKKEYVKMGPKSLNAALTVEIEYDCTCDCEKESASEVNSHKCSNAGTYQCGICKCNQNRYGAKCGCEGESEDLLDLANCKQNETDDLICNGRGKCVCGVCDCWEGFTGHFCEFDNNACPKPEGLLCHGSGNCTWGQCHCFAGWSPPDCKCPSDQYKNCIAPHSSEPCSGNGECVCGQCQCNKIKGTNETCSGVFCDDCEQFANKRCGELEDYVYCNYMNKTDCVQFSNQTIIDVLFKDKTEMNDPASEWYMANWCQKTFEDQSVLVFRYYYPPSTPNSLFIVIQRELNKPEKADIWVVIGSTIGGIILVGFLTIVLWKVLVDYRDQREYDQFIIKARAAGYDAMNPLYEDPTIKFSNLLHK